MPALKQHAALPPRHAKTILSEKQQEIRLENIPGPAKSHGMPKRKAKNIPLGPTLLRLLQARPEHIDPLDAEKILIEI